MVRVGFSKFPESRMEGKDFEANLYVSLSAFRGLGGAGHKDWQIDAYLVTMFLKGFLVYQGRRVRRSFMINSLRGRVWSARNRGFRSCT